VPRVNRGLLLKFFLTFSRFEYALKNTDYCTRHPEVQRPNGLLLMPRAEPDWDRFATSLRDLFDRNKSEELREASRYLSEEPPNRQILVEGRPAWETPVRGPAPSEIEFLLLMVRCVRNNLFHGGKHNLDVHETTQRTEKLLVSCLEVLRACLALAPQQQQAYDDARL